jgi:hypothetical protein
VRAARGGSDGAYGADQLAPPGHTPARSQVVRVRAQSRPASPGTASSSRRVQSPGLPGKVAAAALARGYLVSSGTCPANGFRLVHSRPGTGGRRRVWDLRRWVGPGLVWGRPGMEGGVCCGPDPDWVCGVWSPPDPDWVGDVSFGAARPKPTMLLASASLWLAASDARPGPQRSPWFACGHTHDQAGGEGPVGELRRAAREISGVIAGVRSLRPAVPGRRPRRAGGSRGVSGWWRTPRSSPERHARGSLSAR